MDEVEKMKRICGETLMGCKKILEGAQSRKQEESGISETMKELSFGIAMAEGMKSGYKPVDSIGKR